jgi:UDP-glucose 4-epimerase
MNKVLVTGGAGFIGHHLLKRLSQMNCQIIVIDNLSNRNENFHVANIKDNILLYTEDIRNKNAVLNIFNHARIDTCIHLAAKVSVHDSTLNPHDTVDVNVMGTLNLLEGCSNHQVKNFVFASSASVYGEPKQLPIKEDHILDPLSPYAASKASAEALVSSYGNLKKIEHVVSLRFFNIFGEGQSLEYAGVITNFLEKISKGLPPIIYGDGKQTRDFISVNDVVNAILLAAQPRNEMSRPGIFNIATGKSISINELAQRMIRISGLDLDPIYEEERSGDVRYSKADVTKSEDVLGFIASENLESTLELLVEHDIS